MPNQFSAQLTGGHIDEACGDREVGDVRHPDLVWAVEDPMAGEVGKDQTVVVAVGRGHEPLAALGLQVVLAHETADLLGVDDYAPMAQLGANPAIAIGFELITDRDHGRDQHGVVSRQ